MPIYEYIARDYEHSCEHCEQVFEIAQRLDEPRLEVCPKCGSPVRKEISCAAIGRSQSSLDDRAKSAGFTKLKKLGHGEYEKQF